MADAQSILDRSSRCIGESKPGRDGERAKESDGGQGFGRPSVDWDVGIFKVPEREGVLKGRPASNK